MPTANSTAPRRATTGVKRARRTAGAQLAGSTTRTSKVKPKRAKAKRAKTGRARATSQAQSSVRSAPAATRLPISDLSVSVFGDYAERAVLIPVGVALTARDRVVSSVGDTISTYSSTAKTQAQLRRFERRGATARKRLEREVRKTRVRVERELRQRRRVIERTVSDLEDRRDTVAKNGTELANRVPELAGLVQERIQERIQSLV
jgi:hypothetical protein